MKRPNTAGEVGKKEGDGRRRREEGRGLVGQGRRRRRGGSGLSKKVKGMASIKSNNKNPPPPYMI